MNFFMVYDIIIDQLNLGPFKNSFFWMKFHLKIVFYFNLFGTESKIIYF